LSVDWQRAPAFGGADGRLVERGGTIKMIVGGGQAGTPVLGLRLIRSHITPELRAVWLGTTSVAALHRSDGSCLLLCLHLAIRPD